jgi:hypothetical protein
MKIELRTVTRANVQVRVHRQEDELDNRYITLSMYWDCKCMTCHWNVSKYCPYLWRKDGVYVDCRISTHVPYDTKIIELQVGQDRVTELIQQA